MSTLTQWEFVLAELKAWQEVMARRFGRRHMWTINFFLSRSFRRGRMAAFFKDYRQLAWAIGFGKSRGHARDYVNFLLVGKVLREVRLNWHAFNLNTEKGILEGINYLTWKLITNGLAGQLGLAGDAGQLDLIRQCVEKNKLEELIKPANETGFASPTFDPPLGVTDPAAILLLKLYFNGQRSVPFAGPTLKHTRIVYERWFSPATVPSFATLYSTMAMIADFFIPAGILIQLPSNDSGIITIPIYVLDPINTANIAQTVFQRMGYGWLRSAREVTPISNGRWNLSETFEYGLWNLDICGGRLHDVTL